MFVYVFGVADVSREKSKLLEYGYSEEQGGKGWNNVASLLIKALHALGWLIRDRCIGNLSIVMDNCGGQNINKMVEKNYFKLAEFMFFVGGHTKNVCDRQLSALKICYHKANVPTMDMLHQVSNELDAVTFCTMSSHIFFDYDDTLNNCYKQFKSGPFK